MKTKTAILSTIMLALFSISSAHALEKSCDHGDRGSSSSSMGDNTRERGDPSSRGQGELNHDNNTQAGEAASAAQTGIGTRLSDIGRGAPTDPGNTFNSTREETMEHD